MIDTTGSLSNDERDQLINKYFFKHLFSLILVNLFKIPTNNGNLYILSILISVLKSFAQSKFIVWHLDLVVL